MKNLKIFGDSIIKGVTYNGQSYHLCQDHDFDTIDAKGAKAIIEQAHPKCVIPMHYKTAHCTYPIAGVEPFLRAMGAENVKPVRELEVRPGNVPEGVVVMEALEEWA